MDLEKIRQQLEQDKQALINRLEKIEADIEHGRSRDWEEQAQERENDEVLEGLSVEGTAQLQRIDDTLAKIANGEFGRCDRCQKPINPSRLEALPTAQYCLDCAE